MGPTMLRRLAVPASGHASRISISVRNRATVHGALSTTRRQVLQRGLFGGALLAGSGLGLGWLASRRGPAAVVPEGLQVFDALEYGALAAIAGRMIPPRLGFPALDVALRADALLAGADPRAQADVRGLVRLFENGLTQLLFGLRPRPFSALTAEAQDSVLADWSTSRLRLRRTGVAALRGLLMAAYYSSPQSWTAVGYPGPPAGFHDPEAR
jgi:hypothetical protein